MVVVRILDSVVDSVVRPTVKQAVKQAQVSVPMQRQIQALHLYQRGKRLVVGDDQVMVIDYKTNRPPPIDEAGVAPAYILQMARYRAVLSRIYPGKSICCALLWTNGPRLMELSDAVLSRHTP